MRRVDVHAVARRLLDQLHLPRRQLVGILVHVRGADRVQGLFTLVLPCRGAILAMTPARALGLATRPCGYGTVLVAGLFGADGRQILAQPLGLLGRGRKTCSAQHRGHRHCDQFHSLRHCHYSSRYGFSYQVAAPCRRARQPPPSTAHRFGPGPALAICELLPAPAACRAVTRSLPLSVRPDCH